MSASSSTSTRTSFGDSPGSSARMRYFPSRSEISTVGVQAILALASSSDKNGWRARSNSSIILLKRENGVIRSISNGESGRPIRPDPRRLVVASSPVLLTNPARCEERSSSLLVVCVGLPCSFSFAMLTFLSWVVLLAYFVEESSIGNSKRWGRLDDSYECCDNPGRLSSSELFHMGQQRLEIAEAYMSVVVDEESWSGSDAALAGIQNVLVHAKGMGVQHHVAIEAFHVEADLSGVHPKVFVRKSELMIKKEVVHLPEFALGCRGFCCFRSTMGARV